MGRQLGVDVDHALATSHAVSNDAVELRDDLASISRQWEHLSQGWIGAVASAYDALWRQWHEGAATLVEALAQSSEMLGRAAMAYAEGDADSADKLGSSSVEMGL